MAKIKYGKKEIIIKDNSSIKEACKELGVFFGCESGVCGTCMIKIKKGYKNLSNKNDKEKRFSTDPKYRLACQCNILNGEVEIDF
ncbi:MAG: 2Fe-2S iron-sulfur cluster-binding protein [Candidatus Pacearchaeota archaeon]